MLEIVLEHVGVGGLGVGGSYADESDGLCDVPFSDFRGGFEGEGEWNCLRRTRSPKMATACLTEGKGREESTVEGEEEESESGVSMVGNKDDLMMEFGKVLKYQLKSKEVGDMS